MEPGAGSVRALSDTGRPVPLVGRARELDALRSALEDLCAGRGRVFQIMGEPGIGKSRLARAFADEARQAGAVVAWGRCWESGGAPAYWPWVQVIRDLLRSRPEVLSLLDGSGGAAVAEIVPELRAHVGEARPGPDDPEAARFALFDAAARFLHSVGTGEPLVVVLEDLHAADPDSLLLLRFLARDIGASRVLVLATHRNVGAEVSRPVGVSLAELARDSSSIVLHGLAPSEVGCFLAQAMPDAVSQELASTMHQMTGGNPFFLDQLCRSATGDPTSGQSVVPDSVPEGVREVLRQRLRLLSPEARSVLDVAAVVGQEFRLAVLHQVAGVDGGRLVDLLAETQAAGIVVDPSGDSRHYAFVHALMRETIYADVVPSRRAELHRGIGAALERLYRADPEPHLAELAHHLVAGAAVGADTARAVDASAAAGERAMRLLAYEEASAQFQRALDVAEPFEEMDDRRRCQLQLSLGQAQSCCGEVADSKATFERAAAAARHLGDVELFARAAMGRARSGRFGVVDPEIVRLLEESLVLLGDDDSPMRAEAIARLAAELAFVPDPRSSSRSVELAAEAVALARRLGDPATLARALSTQQHVKWTEDNAQQRLQTSSEVRRLADAAGDREMALQGHMWALIARLELGDVPAFEGELRSYGRLAGELGQPLPLFYASSRQVTAALVGGHFEQAERLLDGAAAWARRAQHAEAIFISALQRGFLSWERGDVDGLRNLQPEVETWAGLFEVETLAFALATPAWLHLALGELPEATALLARAAGLGLARLSGWSQDRVCALVWLSEVAVAVDDQALVSELYDLLSPRTGGYVVVGGAIAFWGAIDHHLGRMATKLGRWSEAEAHFELALERHAAMGARPWLTRTERSYAEMRSARDGPGDRQRATALCTLARARDEELGMAGVVAALPSTTAPSARHDRQPDTPEPLFVREGDYWSLSFRGHLVRLRDAKGLVYLAELVQHPGREFHVVELVSMERGAPAGAEVIGHAGELLDPTARSAYRARLTDLGEDLEEAQAMCDEGRVAIVQAEIDALVDQLAAAVGLGGRSRVAASASERARVSVTNALRRALARIEEAHPVLGQHLASSVTTGSYCAYRPPT